MCFFFQLLKMKARRAAFQRCDMKARNSLCVIMKKHTSAVQEDEKNPKQVGSKAVKSGPKRGRRMPTYIMLLSHSAQ